MAAPVCLMVALASASTLVRADADGGYGPATFDVDARRQMLLQPQYEAARTACLAAEVADVGPVPQPVLSLEATDAYGSDQTAEAFSWSVMVLSGRSLAGDESATRDLIAGLVDWARAGALEGTPTDYDPFYAMKRVLLPTTVAFRIVADAMTDDERSLVEAWLDGLVRRVDTTFSGDVDFNNHRYLADLVLMTWGSIVRDRELLDKGAGRIRTALEQTRPDGSLPLETRRGSRAMWYSNMAVGELTMMARVAALNDIDLGVAGAATTQDGLLAYLASVLATPALILPYAAENYIPGPNPSYREQDLGFTERRGHQRHYMAWTESLADAPGAGPAAVVISAYREANLAGLRPLIDEYASGAATCFWWHPGGE